MTASCLVEQGRLRGLCLDVEFCPTKRRTGPDQTGPDRTRPDQTGGIERMKCSAEGAWLWQDRICGREKEEEEEEEDRILGLELGMHGKATSYYHRLSISFMVLVCVRDGRCVMGRDGETDRALVNACSPPGRGGRTHAFGWGRGALACLAASVAVAAG